MPTPTVIAQYRYSDSINRRYWDNKYFFDEIYEILFVRTTTMLSCFSKQIDKVIDVVPNSSADFAQISAAIVSRLQNGYIFSYAFYILLGLLGIMSWWIMCFLS